MTTQQLEQFKEYAAQIKHNRDYYSRSWIIEHLVGWVETTVVKSVCGNCKEEVKPIPTGHFCPKCSCDMQKGTTYKK